MYSISDLPMWNFLDQGQGPYIFMLHQSKSQLTHF